VKNANGKRTLDQAGLDRARKLAGLKGYVTNIDAATMPAAEVIASYHDPWHVEQSFRAANACSVVRTPTCSILRATCRHGPRQGATQPSVLPCQDRSRDLHHPTSPGSLAGDLPGHRIVQPGGCDTANPQRCGLRREPTAESEAVSRRPARCSYVRSLIPGSEGHSW
jgi:hypothetical protein